MPTERRSKRVRHSFGLLRHSRPMRLLSRWRPRISSVVTPVQSRMPSRTASARSTLTFHEERVEEMPVSIRCFQARPGPGIPWPCGAGPAAELEPPVQSIRPRSPHLNGKVDAEDGAPEYPPTVDLKAADLDRLPAGWQHRLHPRAPAGQPGGRAGIFSASSPHVPRPSASRPPDGATWSDPPLVRDLPAAETLEACWANC